jgi:hypothetical protein
MSTDWKVGHAEPAAKAIGGEVLDISNEFFEDNHILIYRCPDGRVIVFENWWFRVSEFANEETFQKALTAGNEDYSFDLDLAIKNIRLE